MFVLHNVELCIHLYHKIRNYVVSLIHLKLLNLHNKLKTIQASWVRYLFSRLPVPTYKLIINGLK